MVGGEMYLHFGPQKLGSVAHNLFSYFHVFGNLMPVPASKSYFQDHFSPSLPLNPVGVYFQAVSFHLPLAILSTKSFHLL